ncbi:MAG TPA: CDP-diacylglycerol--glycerol-3-phosphate 3-phosphatidyltransferase [Pirellulales bacterium]|jgi:CDP-diacylglycerol--glycerol-3-phosphate 3-phosphatidyltransferase|nr:CDP-diacylglycerol--glycerol-3-phosphate 3-phosphatidyltransferase [Pirellulales bacterium]
MTASTKPQPSAAVFNLPNQLTVLRLALSLVLFGLITFKLYAIGFFVFVVAASTDWLDGYFARKYGMVTTLGRILDPFVDKIIICGTFICLVADKDSEIQGWMAVVVVGRELLITALRSFLEQQGADFSATMSGKLKMLLQCLAAGASLFYLSKLAAPEGGASPDWVYYTLVSSVWAALLLTVYSGVEYVRRAMLLWRQ